MKVTGAGPLASPKFLIEQRDVLSAQAHQLLIGSPYDVLCSLPGVGPVIALTILAEAGAMRRFAHHRHADWIWPSLNQANA